MCLSDIEEKLALCPVVAAVHDGLFDEALLSPTKIIFLLEGDVMTVGSRIKQAHKSGKTIFIHIDLLKGIGKDRCGVEFLAQR